MTSSCCFGLHLGNSFASIAISKDGKTEVLANEQGDFVTPAIFALQDDGTTVVGLAAKQQIARNSGACVINCTWLLNQSSDENLEEIRKITGSSVTTTTDGFSFKLQRDDVERDVSVETVLLEILGNVNSIADHAFKSVDHPVVLSVPLNFSQKGRQKLAKIAEKSGFQVLQIISDPAAAALAYNVKGETPENVLIYRLGATSKDVTVLRVEDGLYEVVANYHENAGCNSLDKLLVDYIAKEFYQKYKLDPNESRRTISKLYAPAQTAKHILSSMNSAHVFIESLMDGVDFSHNLSRARFENLIAPYLSEVTEPIKKVQSEANISHFDKIILCGGGMRIPKFQSTIAGMFPNATLLNSLNPEEVLAVGCTKQASLLSKNWDPQYEHLDVEVESLVCDIVVKVEAEEVVEVKSGALTPLEKSFSVEKTGSVVFDIFERSDGDDDLTKIGEVSLEVAELDELALKIDGNGVQISKVTE